MDEVRSGIAVERRFTSRRYVFFASDGDSILKRCGTIPHGVQDAFHPQVHLSGLEWER